jgi:hypothetical protein
VFLAGAALAGFVAARVFRAADTDSLKQAATDSNGSSSNGVGEPGPSLSATPTPSLAASSPATPATGVLPTEAP